MNLKIRKGMTFTEALVSVILLSTVLGSILGVFFIARASTVRASHRMIAMNLVREWMEKEIANGYGSGGYDVFNSATDGTRVIDGVTYTISAYPNPSVISFEGGAGGVPYKTIGFQVSWNEVIYSQAGSVACNERAVTNVSWH